ncbi:MAG: hypothetical protein JNK87_31170 [Bryobacterales bacterium]|nr:hypothetical protein [Bryobacterales bacterium]
MDTYDDDGNTRYTATRLRVPVCSNCLQRHHTEGKVWSLPARLLLCFRSFLIIAVIGASVMFSLVAPAFLRNLLKPDPIGILAFGAVLAFFAAIALLSLRAAWNETERFALSPPTSVSRMVHWTTDLSAMFEPEHHDYTFVNRQFSQAMLDRNRHRLWNPASPVARQAASRRRTVKYLLLAILALFLLLGVLKEYGCTAIHTF